MRKLASLIIFLVFIMPISVFAQIENASPSPFSGRLAIAARFFGGFLLVMGAIFVILISTQSISEWIEKVFKKK